MNKILYFSGVLVLLSGITSSCDEIEADENNGDSKDKDNVVSRKKLKHLVSYTSDHRHEFVDGEENLVFYEISDTTTFEYDKSGKCVAAIFGNGSKCLYTYEGSEVIADNYMGDSLTSHYELSLNSKGYVSSYGSNIMISFEYDDTGHLILNNRMFSYSSNYRSTTYTWEDGNISTANLNMDGSDYELTTYHYTDESNPTPIENLGGIDITDEENYHPVYGNMGVATKYLPVSKTLKYNFRTEEVKYKWAFDADGYPTDVQIASTLGGTHYSFAWE